MEEMGLEESSRSKEEEEKKTKGREEEKEKKREKKRGGDDNEEEEVEKVCLIGFSMFSSATILYRGRMPRLTCMLPHRDRAQRPQLLS